MKKIINYFFFAIFFLSLFFKCHLNAQDIGAEWIVPPVLEVDKLEISPRDVDDRFIVIKEKKKGLYDRSGKEILPIEYNWILTRSCGWIWADKEGKKYLFNEKIEPIGLPYDDFRPQNNGLAIVYKDGMCGLINMKGEELVPLKYKDFIFGRPYIFKNDEEELKFDPPPDHLSQHDLWERKKRAKFKINGYSLTDGGNNKKGLINEKGETVVSPEYFFSEIHPDGYIVASFDRNTWGVINTAEKTLFPFILDKTGKWTESGLIPVRSEKQWGVLRFPSGEEVIPFGEYASIKIYDPQKNHFLVTKNKLQGIINARGEIVMPLKYTYISHWSHYVHELSLEDGSHGFWNDKNGFISKFNFDRVRNLKDSLVIVEKDRTWAVIDAKNGEIVIPFSDFRIEKKGPYFISHKKWNPKMRNTLKGRLNGLYDRTGQLFIPHDSVDIVVFKDHTIWVHPQAPSAQTEAYHRTKDGKILRKLNKIDVDVRNANNWIFNSKDKEGIYKANLFSYLDPPGKEIYYQSVGKLIEKIRLVKKDNKYGFTDDEGRVLIKVAFDEAEQSEKGYIKVKHNGKWGVLQNPNFDYFKGDK